MKISHWWTGVFLVYSKRREKATSELSMSDSSLQKLHNLIVHNSSYFWMERLSVIYHKKEQDPSVTFAITTIIFSRQ